MVYNGKNESKRGNAMENDVLTIKKNVVKSCDKSAKNVEIPDGILEISHYAFQKCILLESVKLPDSLERIDVFAFVDCSALSKIELPQNIKEIANGAFLGCNNIKEISYKGSLESWQKLAGKSNILPYVRAKIVHCCDGDYQKDTLIFADKMLEYCDEDCENAEIPEGIIAIGLWAFDECKKLKSLAIPSSLQAIGIRAFEGCNNLNDIVFGGTKEQFKNIKGKENLCLYAPAKIIHCKDGDLKVR